MILFPERVEGFFYPLRMIVVKPVGFSYIINVYNYIVIHTNRTEIE